MQLKSSGHTISRLWQRGMRDSHSRLMIFVLLFVLCYLPTWFGIMIQGLTESKSDSILNVGFVALSFKTIYQHRSTLKSQRAESDDRFLGYALIVCGFVTFIIFHSLTWSSSFQALAVMLMLVGVAWSNWGLGFFRQFPLSTALMLIAVYPDIAYIMIRVCRFFTSEDMLEQVMAWAGAIGLNLMGYQATTQSALVLLPEGSVLVAPGCSGFDMAFTLLGTGFLMGKFMHLSWHKTGMIMAIGWGLSMILNVPRIMQLALASVYWGQESFDFWHGPIGGQIFSCILFTIYYYLVMWIIDRGQSKPGAGSSAVAVADDRHETSV